MNYLLKVNFLNACITEEIYFKSFLSIGIYKNSYRLFTEIGIETIHFCFYLSLGFIRSSRVENNIANRSNTRSLSKVIVEALGFVLVIKPDEMSMNNHAVSPGFIRSSRVEDNLLNISNLGLLFKAIVEALGIVSLIKMVIMSIDTSTSTMELIRNTILEKWASLYRGGSRTFKFKACIKNNPVILVNQYL